jgi:hypothetical protein
MELGRPVSRPQPRLQPGQVQDRRRLQRCHARHSPVRHRFLGFTQRRHRRRASRLHLAGGQLGGRPRRRHPDVGARRNAELRLSRRNLQSNRRRFRRASDGEVRARPKARFVRHAARAPRHHHHARCHRLRYRRPRGRLNQDRHHPFGRRFRRQWQPLRVRRPCQRAEDQAGVDGRRRPRSPPVRQRDRQGRIPLHGFRHRRGLRHQCGERDADHVRHQFARHRQHRARRRQLQIRSRRWRLRRSSQHRRAAHLQGAGLWRTGRGRMELGRALCRNQRRLQRGKIEDRCGVQRSDGCAAVHHRFHGQPQRRDRRLSRRL